MLVAVALYVAAFVRSSGSAQALVNGQPVETVSRTVLDDMARQQTAALQMALPKAAKGINTVTDANGAFTAVVTDAAGPFTSNKPVYTADAVFVGGPTKCQITSRSSDRVAGICYLASPQTLPGLATALLGLVIDPWKQRVPAGTEVMIVGREPTQ
jgi:hypothetical protein